MYKEKLNYKLDSILIPYLLHLRISLKNREFKSIGCGNHIFYKFDWAKFRTLGGLFGISLDKSMCNSHDEFFIVERLYELKVVDNILFHVGGQGENKTGLYSLKKIDVDDVDDIPDFYKDRDKHEYFSSNFAIEVCMDKIDQFLDSRLDLLFKNEFRNQAFKYDKQINDILMFIKDDTNSYDSNNLFFDPQKHGLNEKFYTFLVLYELEKKGNLELLNISLCCNDSGSENVWRGIFGWGQEIREVKIFYWVKLLDIDKGIELKFDEKDGLLHIGDTDVQFSTSAISGKILRELFKESTKRHEYIDLNDVIDRNDPLDLNGRTWYARCKSINEKISKIDNKFGDFLVYDIHGVSINSKYQ